MKQGHLKKRLNIFTLTLYGLGTTIGAGIYALVGELAATTGYFMPVSFLLAAVLACLTGLSFAELSSRFPFAAGEARYVREGLKSPRLSLIVGIMIAAAGMVSSAGIINGFVGYLQDLFGAHRELSILFIILLMTALACWGIRESVGIAVVITLIEIGGLLMVIGVGAEDLVRLPELGSHLMSATEPAVWGGIISGTFLAFFAFIGFEDMVNVAEETKDATRTVPRAIILTLALTTVFYILIALVAVLSVPMDQLSGHPAPLKLIFAEKTGTDGSLLGYIAIIAMVNGALVQIVMASRVAYGLSRQGSLPAFLGKVHIGRGTPIIATVGVAAIVLALALWFRLGGLAQATSVITLTVFTLVNLSLIMIKRRNETSHEGTVIPVWIPYLGAVGSLAILIIELGSVLH